jgi:hypothetical protein
MFFFAKNYPPPRTTSPFEFKPETSRSYAPPALPAALPAVGSDQCVRRPSSAPALALRPGSFSVPGQSGAHQSGSREEDQAEEFHPKTVLAFADYFADTIVGEGLEIEVVCGHRRWGGNS